MRRKIEYVPLARPIDTAGGRDLKLIEAEVHNLNNRRPLRDLADWGVVEMDSLIMSLRSRLSIELSYSLTTLTVLTSLPPDCRMVQLMACIDLLDELLDLIEDIAYPEGEQEEGPNPIGSAARNFSNRQLVNLVQETEGSPFAALQHGQGSKDPSLGPVQRPADLLLAITNILRNMSIRPDNADIMANHPRCLDLLLRLCDIKVEGGLPRPVSKALSLSDVLSVRRDVLSITAAAVFYLDLFAIPSGPKGIRITRRLFDLVCSYIVDPEGSVSPTAFIQQPGGAPNLGQRPPSLVDCALDMFTRLAFPDSNRQVISKIIPTSAFYPLLTSLVHRLPVTEADFFLICHRSPMWLAHIERIVMSLYSIVFMATPELKQRIRADRSLGFKSVLMRLVRSMFQLVNAPNQPPDPNWTVCARRSVETMKLLDRTEDPFEKKEVDEPVLAFGMGFTDADESTVEKGTGLLGGQLEMAWELLFLRDFCDNQQLFGELDSLMRVECQ